MIHIALYLHDLTMLNSTANSVQHKIILIKKCVLPLRDLTMFNPAVSSVICTTSDHFQVAHVQEHVLLLHDLTMFNPAVSSVQHQITFR